MSENASTIRRRVAAKIARMSPEQARAKYNEANADSTGVYNKVIRDLTGGYNSQSLDFEVRRKLASKAGII